VDLAAPAIGPLSEFHFDDDLPGREINHGDTRQRMIAFRYASRPSAKRDAVYAF
jgi:hypothetical protein